MSSRGAVGGDPHRLEPGGRAPHDGAVDLHDLALRRGDGGPGIERHLDGDPLFGQQDQGGRVAAQLGQHRRGGPPDS